MKQSLVKSKVSSLNRRLMSVKSSFILFLLVAMSACSGYKSEYSPIFGQMFETLAHELKHSVEALELTMTNVAFVLEKKADSLEKTWVLERGEAVIEASEAVVYWIESQKQKLMANESPERLLEVAKGEKSLLVKKLKAYQQFLNKKNHVLSLGLKAFPSLVAISEFEKIVGKGEQAPRSYMHLKFENVSTESALLTLVQIQIDVIGQAQTILNKITEKFQQKAVYPDARKYVKVRHRKQTDSTIIQDFFLAIPLFENKLRLYPKKLIAFDTVYNFRTGQTTMRWKTDSIFRGNKTFKAIYYDVENLRDTILTVSSKFIVRDTIPKRDEE